MTSTPEKFTVGERVFVVTSRNIRRTVVTDVKATRRGPKVTTTGGTTWDIANGGDLWGTRSQSYYDGPVLKKSTDELVAAHLDQHRRKAVAFVLDVGWDCMTDEQREQFGDLARVIRREIESRTA